MLFGGWSACSFVLKEKFCCVIGILDVYSCSLRFDTVLIRGIITASWNNTKKVLTSATNVEIQNSIGGDK